MKDFLERAEAYYYAGRRTAQVGAAALGLEGVLLGDSPRDDVNLLRLLDYVASPDETLGAAHFDRSVATLALDESDTGLRGAPGQNGFLEPVTVEDIEAVQASFEPVPHYEHVAKFFLAAGINRLAPKVRARAKGLPLLGHDITNDRPGESRQAVVMFLNPYVNYPGYEVPVSDPVKGKGSETGFDDIIQSILARAA